mmetsp:Transcript_29668/g.95308  ORF Transcript_29668/g.95308 Transcript_29668/m.95308 type:complete len:210 (-) Transcript_29668:382-1011(-)
MYKALCAGTPRDSSWQRCLPDCTNHGLHQANRSDLQYPQSLGTTSHPHASRGSCSTRARAPRAPHALVPPKDLLEELLQLFLIRLGLGDVLSLLSLGPADRRCLLLLDSIGLLLGSLSRLAHLVLLRGPNLRHLLLLRSAGDRHPLPTGHGDRSPGRKPEPEGEHPTGRELRRGGAVRCTRGGDDRAAGDRSARGGAGRAGSREAGGDG